VAGIVGPVAFTAAWVTSSLRQTGRPATEIQISGLAAPGARDPWIMVTGFLVLGGSLVAFGPALRQALTEPDRRRRAGPAPALIETAGLLTVAAGLLRRDHALLTSGRQSWHNQAHDAVSAVIYALLVVIPPLLAWRLRGHPRWRGLPPALTACTVATAVILGLFQARNTGPWAGALQRAGVTVPLAALVAVAAVTAASRTPRPGRGGRT
jgi:hypothetical protein